MFEKMRGGMKNAMGFRMMMLVVLAEIPRESTSASTTHLNRCKIYIIISSTFIWILKVVSAGITIAIPCLEHCIRTQGLRFRFLEQRALDEEWDATAPYCYDDTGNGRVDSDGSTCGVLYWFDA